MMLAAEALERFLRYPDIRTVLDIGSGDGTHASLMRRHGKCVTTLSLHEPADIVGDYLETTLPPVDGIWASHVLEHAPNVGLFLEKCFRDLRPDGLLAITVPPAKHNIVGGHLSLWNEGLLLYHLILAGFDCRHAQVGVYDYNISVLVQKKSAYRPPLAMDAGDIEKLAAFFPMPVEQGFNGQTGNINWDLKPKEGRDLVGPAPVTWRHPTGKRPRVVNLVCLGPSQADYISSCFDREPPDFILQADEVWTLNRGSICFFHHLRFVMDNLEGEMQQYPLYCSKLWNDKSTPIITSDACEGWPPHVLKYPFQEIEKWLIETVQCKHSDWISNSVGFVLNYAAWIGVKELNIFGADYQHHASGRIESGHANSSYFCGVLERVGLTVHPIGSSYFLGACQRDSVYGYKTDPRAGTARRIAENKKTFQEWTHENPALD